MTRPRVYEKTDKVVKTIPISLSRSQSSSSLVFVVPPHSTVIKRFPAPRSPISETVRYVRDPRRYSSDH
jgi:hypothetical protein